jgi:hypothetical protein
MFNWCKALSMGIKRSERETNHSHLMPMLGTHEAAPPFPHTSSWNDVSLI